jgi:hypothetical protein
MTKSRAPWSIASMKRKKLCLEEEWHEQAEALKRKAEQLPYGKEYEELLRKARQLETASHVNEWLSSPGLAPPR